MLQVDWVKCVITTAPETDPVVTATVTLSAEVAATSTIVPSSRPGTSVTSCGRSRYHLHSLMVEHPNEKTTVPGKPDVNEGSVPVGTVELVATKGAESGKSAAACLKPNLLPAEAFTQSQFLISCPIESLNYSLTLCLLER